MKLQFLMAVCTIALCGTLHSASAQTVLFSDTFDRTTGSGDGNGNPAGTGNGSSDWGTNTGVGTINYVAGPSRGGGRNQVVGANQFSTATPTPSHGYLFDGGARADLGTLLSSSPDGFRVEFDFDRFADPAFSNTIQGGYIAFGLGNDDSAGVGNGAALNTLNTFSLLFQQGVGGNVGNAELWGNQTSIGTADYGDPLASHNVRIDFTPGSSGAYGVGDAIDYEVFIDGSGTALFSNSFNVDSGDLNKFAFSSNDPGFNGNRLIDNLTFSSLAAIPEPGSAIVGMLGIGMYALRRRRS